MAGLLPGEQIYVSYPIGTFTSNMEKAFWIAAGTGIAPYASMFYSGLSENKILIHGGKSLNSFYFQGDFMSSMRERYIRCCSKESGDGIYHGRLTEYIKQIAFLDPDMIYYF
jgi:ferredoxin--NADP+ reductase